MYIVQKYVRRLQAALKIQKYWKGYKCRTWLQKLKCGLLIFQAHCRGFRIRKIIAESKAKEKIIKKSQVILIYPIKINYMYYFYLFRLLYQYLHICKLLMVVLMKPLLVKSQVKKSF